MRPGDGGLAGPHNPSMAKRATDQKHYGHTWYLREWLDQYGLRQVDMQKAMEWSKGKANDVFNGQQYSQAMVDQLAPWLKVRPYELLMPPSEAIALRRVREDAARIVADSAPPADAPPLRRTG